MQPWRLLDLTAYDACMNMAIDEAMLKACARKSDAVSTIRFYTWTPAAVSIGCLQKISDHFDLNQAQESGLAVVRRPTGGRAVLHKGDISCSLVLAESNPVIPRGVLASYQKISQAIQRGLGILGIEAQLCPERRISRTPFCFSGAARYEILVQGKKVMGNAQRREEGALLQQGSIMIEDQRELICRLFPQPERFSRSGGKAISGEESGQSTTAGLEFISLEEAAGGPVTASLVKDALIQGFEEVLHISLVPGSLTFWEHEEAIRLSQEKYSQDIWTRKGQHW
ncbi:MAG: lipoate--protein ligase family protein [bacterium]